MSLYKRSGRSWTDVTVNGIRYREARDWREALRLERDRIQQLQNRAPDPNKRGKSYGSIDIETAAKSYIVDRRAQVLPRMVFIGGAFESL